MNPSPTPSNEIPAGVPFSPARKRGHWFLWVLGGLAAMFVLIGITAAFTIYWIQRPIKPVVLTAAEKSAVEKKLTLLSDGQAWADTQKPADSATETRRGMRVRQGSPAPPETERGYVAGSKVLRLTERELNGLLNANTDLGKTLRLELSTDAINAYLAVPIPEEFPVGAGKMFRARGRFRVSLGDGQAPLAVLEDVTVFGLSLPKAWLGGIKGENLISDSVGNRDGSPLIRGIKSLRLEPGALLIQVED